ncbi:sensor histidine kinase [Winogradskyella ursingii]|uniref:sensor histidine kinase n=1 Tax=Winogradskyella ursingii TaxID=2686079 RepID=UPI0015CB2F19|nr:GAF domain-containing sensor histidine kinase [Winogradskyella ursingii]
MITPKLPQKEQQRLEAVKSYQILDTLPESDYDNITELVASICDVPIALITFLDEKRNYFKSHQGIPFNESPRDISFCGHAILEDDVMIVEDARKDPRFVENPLIDELKAIFYAGQPLVDSNGLALGTICVFDHKPRTLSKKQKKALKTLGNQVVNLLELRRKNINLERTKEELKIRNIQLKSFASHVSHDLKSPLANIISLTELLKDDNDSKLSEDAIIYLDSIEDSANILKDYIDGILMHYKTDDLLERKKQDIKLSEISEDIKQLLISSEDELIYVEHEIKNINKSVLSQILINLVDNAIKYNDKPKRIIQLDYELLDGYHRFSVSDNGIGIPKNQQEQIFEIFKTVKNSFTKSSTGIGLSTVKNLIEKQNGHIFVCSEEGKGSTFSFTIAA